MIQNKFYGLNDLNLDIIKSNFNLIIILDNINLLSLFKLILNKKNDRLNITLKISWISDFDEKILLKLLSLNIIKKVILDLNSIVNIKWLSSLIFILWRLNFLKIKYIFNFELFTPNLLLLIFKEKLDFWNIEEIILRPGKSSKLLSYFYVLDIILKIFKNKWFDRYLIEDIPNCFLLNEHKNIINWKKINNVNKNCSNCYLLNKCWWIEKNNLKIFPITFDIKVIDLNLLYKISKSVILSNINSDIENKYPVDTDLINRKFIWWKDDFFNVINNSWKDLSLYIHIPFCISKCNFCCCPSQEWASYNQQKDYLKKLISEINIFWEKIKNKRIKNVFFWWWTPSFYSENDLFLIFSALRKNFDLVNGFTNIAFEVTESSINEKKIDFLKEMWVTNIYIWLQTSDKELLKNINRIQNVDRFINLSNYIKKKWINLSVDIVVWLKWDTLKKLENTINIIEKVWPNSLQVCRFELFWNITWDYKNYIPKFIEDHFNFAKKKLIKLGYKQSTIYDEIFYLDKDKISTYDYDVLMWITDLIWFWAFAKSKILDNLEWENKNTENYLMSNNTIFSNKKYINILNKWDYNRHYIISTIDDNIFDITLLNKFLNLDNIINKTNFFIETNNKIKLNKIYNTRHLSKVIWWLFFDDNYLNEIYIQELFNIFIKFNYNFYKYLWAKLDNYDNVYPIDPILDDITEDDKYNLWKSYLENNVNNKSIFHIDKLWLYIHIPFCSTICSFCSCKTDTDLHRIDDYILNLIKEIKKYWKIFKWYSFKTIYFGWWTPWILNNNQLKKIFWALYENFTLIDDIYISFEATPYSLNESKLQLLKKFWVKRLSIWLQSLDRDVLTNINRPQSIKYLYKLFSLIKKVGIDYISVDFVAWLKWETIETVKKMLEFVTLVKPDSIHLYQYYVDRSNSNEEYDKKRIDEIEKLFYFTKKWFQSIWYNLAKEHDSVFLLNPWVVSNLHDYNFYKYNNSVLALWEYSEWHIFWKLYYKNIKNWIIKGKIVNNKEEFWIFFIKNLEFGINILDFKNIFRVNLLELFKNEISYLYANWYIYIENNIIKTNISNHLDYISLYKIFWPEKELFKFYIEFLISKKDKIDYNLFNSKPIK